MHKSLLLGLLASVIGSADLAAQGLPFPPADNPWPEIRRERIKQLLPQAMQRAGVDAWVLIARENNNDPLAVHVGAENAGGTAAFVFLLESDSIRAIAASPGGEATALAETGPLDTVITIPRGTNAYGVTAQIVADAGSRSIAINSSGLAAADGLSYSQRLALEEAFGELDDRLVSSQELVTQWLSVKLPEEAEIMARAAQLTDQIEREAYRQVVPGVTTDADLARFIKQRMAELGVGDAWSPAQNPNVNSGPDRGHSHATERVIQPGSIIQIDFGIRVWDIWVTDIQRFAYVLRTGETVAPPEMIERWEAARAGSRAAFNAMNPGVPAWQVDRAQRVVMEERGSLPVPWSTGHPVGYWAHDVGPALSCGMCTTPRSGSARELLPGNAFAYDGFFSWEFAEGVKTISVEEMVYITPDGPRWMVEPQEELILIPSAN